VNAYRDNIRWNALRARLARDGFCTRRQAAALSDVEVESAHMGLRKNWPNHRRRRRHQRLYGSERTLCGRSAFAVQLARDGAPYPKDRANCATCSNAAMANMARAFAGIWARFEAGAGLPGDVDLRSEGRRRQA